MRLLLALSLLGSSIAHAGLRSSLRDFCERYLASEDPDQYSHLNADALISTKAYYLEQQLNSKTIDDEMRRRLHFDYELTAEERVLLTSALSMK